SQSDDFWDAMNAGKYNGIDLASTLEDHFTSPKTINRNFEKRQTKIVKIESRKREGYVTKDEMEWIIKKQTADMIRYFESKPEYIAFDPEQKIARIRKSGKDVQVMSGEDSTKVFKAS